MRDEERRILKMLEDGKITAEQAEKLFSALPTSSGMEMQSSSSKARWLKIRVFEGDMQNPKVRVNIPISLMKVLMKLGVKFSDKIPPSVQATLEEKGISAQIDSLTPEQLDELLNELTDNGPLKLVEVDEENERVEIFIE
ncbi:hypothetical protein DRQ33_08060 [bacterium]|nr:MAG: hypothetical protein DRQ33_08060 [bacterium]